MPPEIITDIDYISIDADASGEEWMGYTIQTRAAPATQTTLKPIGVYINIYQQCCERYDVLFLAPPGMIEEDFLGAEVRRVGWGRKLCDEYAFREGFPFDPRDTPHAVVEIDTNRGLIQLVPYNDHNGYYPHDIKVQWEGYEDIQRL